MASLTQTSNLMNKKAHGWVKDRNAILLLFLLNIIQGLPQGLFNLTIPITLMEKGATYHNLIFICLSYIPFCSKCFLSPVLNTYYSRRFGKGKTYLVPAFYILGITMLILASKGEKILELESIPFLSVLSIVIMSILTISDICLDGWMVNFISKENSSFAPVCQTIGLNVGSFISFNLFLPLNSLDFCNTFIYSTPQKTPILGAQFFITILAGFILLSALLVHIFLVEEETEYHKPSSITEVLRTVTIFVTNTHFRKILMLFTTWNLIFGPIHNLFTSLLLQKGVSKEMVTNLNAPIPIFIFFFSMWTGALCKKYSAIKVMNGSWLVRLVAAFILYGTIVYLEILPDAVRVPLFFLCLLLGAITYTAVAIAMGAFSSYVAQETFGGPILSTFGAIGNVGRLVADMFSLFSLKYVSWDNLAISSLVGMIFYAIIFVKGMSSFENQNFRRLIGEKEKGQ